MNLNLNNTMEPNGFPPNLRIYGPYSIWYNRFLGIYISGLFMFSVQTNSLVLAIFAKNKQLRTPTNYYVIAMLANDLLVSLFGHTMDLTSFLRSGWQWGAKGCRVYGFFLFFAGHNDIIIVTVMAIDRLVVIRRPMLASKRNFTTFLIVLSICIMHSLLWAILPLVDVNSYVVGYEGITCSIDFPSPRVADIVYTVLITIICWVIPMFIAYFCYRDIFKTVRKLSKTSGISNDAETVRKNMQAEKNMASLSLKVFSGLMVAWTPYTVISFVVLIMGPQKIPTIVLLTPAVFAKSCVVLNPLIYVTNNERFLGYASKTYPWYILFRSKVKPSQVEDGPSTQH